MTAIEIIVIIACSLLVGGVIAAAIVRRVKGKGGCCSGGCANCPCACSAKKHDPAATNSSHTNKL